MDDSADAILMKRLQAGDDPALNELMTRWQQPLAGFIYRYTGNEADALDLAQETFVRIFQHRQRYLPKARFSTWMFAIAANLCRNFLRWRRRHPSVRQDPDNDAREEGRPASPVDPAALPPEVLAQQELAAAVRAAVQSLPHDLRTAVLLFEYEEMSHADIATILECTPKAVETRLYRARAKLRNLLEHACRPGEGGIPQAIRSSV